jgi:hypothetical protein
MHTTRPLVLKPNDPVVEVATGKLKKFKSPGADKIPTKLIQMGWGTLHSEIHKHIKLIWNKKGLRHQWEESTAVRLDKNGDKTDCSNYRGISLRAYGMHEKCVRGLSGKV